MSDALCACGCGQLTWEGKRFVRGHHMRTQEARERTSAAKSTDGQHPRRDLTGQRFHKLLVIEWAEWRPYVNGRESAWRCRCDCGKETVTPQKNLVGGKAKSCGCIIGQHKRTHGATVNGESSPEFRTWSAIHSRCSNSKAPSYKDYGGRGIRVCQRWSSFEAFLDDMGPRPSSEHSIDRYPDNDGNYEPGNCRWATRVEQSNNRRSSRRLTIGAETKTLAEWERHAGLKPGMVHRRLQAGWAPESVLAPPRPTSRERSL